jgi:hypothetical protein
MTCLLAGFAGAVRLLPAAAPRIRRKTPIAPENCLRHSRAQIRDSPLL